MRNRLTSKDLDMLMIVIEPGTGTDAQNPRPRAARTSSLCAWATTQLDDMHRAGLRSLAGAGDLPSSEAGHA
jgi:hypothetical protein